MELILVENNLERAHRIWEPFRMCMSYILLYGTTRERTVTADGAFEKYARRNGVLNKDICQFLRAIVPVDAWKFNAVIDTLYEEHSCGASAYAFLLNLNLEDREVAINERLASLFVDSKRVSEGSAPRTFIYTTMDRYHVPAREYFGNHYVTADLGLSGILDVNSNLALKKIVTVTGT